MNRFVVALLGCCLAVPAWAQGASPTGKFTPGHAMRSNAKSGSPYSDAGGAAGAKRGESDYLTEIGITNTGVPICVNDDFIDSINGYRSICIGHDTSGNAIFAVDSHGGASPGDVQFIVNGVVSHVPGEPNPYLSPINTYISTRGDDNNTCIDSGHPCRTISAAILKGTKGLNAFAQSVNVNIAAGTYSETVFATQPLMGSLNVAPNPNGSNVQPGQVMLIGDGSTTTTLNGGPYCGTIIASGYATIGVSKLKINGNSNNCQSTLFAQIGGTINVYDDVNFGPASIEHIHIENAGSQVQVWYSYTISGGASRHILASSNGLYINNGYPSGTITFSGTPTFTDAFVVAAENGTAQFNSNVSFVGSFIGKKYDAFANGVIDSYPSRSPAWIPGTIVGTTDTGGVYFGPFMATVISRAGSGTGVLIQGDSADVQINTQAPNSHSVRSDSPILASSGAVCAPGMSGDNVTGSFDVSGIGCNMQIAVSTGFIQLATNNAVAFNAFAPIAAVNALQVESAVAGNGPILLSIGSDSSIAMTLKPKGNATLKFDTAALQLSTFQTPASSTAACILGTINIDASYVYVCTSTNVWKRATLDSY